VDNLPPGIDPKDVIFVGVRVLDRPTPAVPSDVYNCDKCGEAIWSDRRAKDMAEAAKKRWCMRCMTDEIQRDMRKKMREQE
jgi:formylmethanofuran dehydrogenase subunit E